MLKRRQKIVLSTTGTSSDHAENAWKLLKQSAKKCWRVCTHITLPLRLLLEQKITIFATSRKDRN